MNPNINDETPRRNADVASGPKTSLIAELLEIQKHQQSAEECQRWANDLTCLLYDTSDPEHFFKVVNSRECRDDFVAVSWTWGLSPRGDKYTFLPSSEWREAHSRKREKRRKEPLDIRDSVLDRVVKYLQAFEEELVWIDRACIEQDDPEEKARAINSMDLIYKEATSSVGLLTSPVLTESDARLLASLLNGNLTEECSPEQFCFRNNMDHRSIHETIRVLRCVLEDGWWKRAWIYQEEYLSGMKMNLLIPINADAQAPHGFDVVEGEFCVRATLFREQSTMFLLACCASDDFRSACSDLLWKVEKFNITLKRDKSSLKPMSAFIFRDVLSRGLLHPWDRLAIIANANGYRRRLDVRILERQKRKLSHCLLALFLLNGEIFNARCDHDMSLLDGDVSRVSRFLDQIQPSFSDLPVSGAGLTFLKYCRLPSAKLCEEGVETQGYIWELPQDAYVDTDQFVLPRLSDIPDEIRERLEDDPWSSSELEMLVEDLNGRKQGEIAGHLCDYMEEAKRERERERERERKGEPRRERSPANKYKDLMACKLMQAINDGQRLRLANLLGTEVVTGIFMPTTSEPNESMHVLTTWRPPRKGDESGIGDAVSVKVTLRSKSPPVVASMAEWINGMVFFETWTDRKPVVVEWPHAWRCRS